MPSGQHEAIPVGPEGVLGVVREVLIVEQVGHRSAAHGQPRVARVGLVDSIDGQEPDCVDGLEELLLTSLGRGNFNSGRGCRCPDHDITGCADSTPPSLN